MKTWSHRERGLGAALVLVALGAIAIPAWADSSNESVEAAPQPATEEPMIISREGDRVMPIPNGRELERFEQCMSEHGVEGPPVPSASSEPHTVPVPAPDRQLERAAEACGMPVPKHEATFAGPGGDEAARLCPPSGPESEREGLR